MMPNGERSHAGHLMPDCNRDALPALAGATCWAAHTLSWFCVTPKLASYVFQCTSHPLRCYDKTTQKDKENNGNSDAAAINEENEKDPNNTWHHNIYLSCCGLVLRVHCRLTTSLTGAAPERH